MKSLFHGIAVATLAGLALGAALRPTLAMDRIGGPQIALADTGRRAYGDAEYQSAASRYPNGLPDYVVGTDNLRQASYEVYGPDAAYDDASYQQVAWAEADEMLPPEPASYRGVTLPTYDAEVRYPSEGGGILAGIDRAPADLGPEVFEPADAPPREMAAFEADRSGPIPYDQAFQTLQ
ncbi:MAG: hypothetical protein KF842_07765 [Caulobacter sp.]|nr:hypothetical protein [Caulobacter sp.]